MRTTNAVDQYMDHCRARGLRPATLRHYAWMLAPFARAHAEVPTRAQELDRYLAGFQGAGRTRWGYYRLLRAFYTFMEHRQMLGRRHWWVPAWGVANPMALVARPHIGKDAPRRVLSFQEAYQLLVAASRRSHRDYALVLLLLHTGARIGELTGLRWSDIDATNQVLHVSGKTGYRDLPLQPAVLSQLVGLGDGEHLFCGLRGPLKVDGMKQAVRSVFSAAGIFGRKTGPHTLRHTFATWFLQLDSQGRRGNVLELMEIMGHEKVATTQEYAMPSPAQVARAHERFNPIAKLGPAIRAARASRRR